jgi:hypothetical protein
MDVFVAVVGLGLTQIGLLVHIALKAGRSLERVDAHERRIDGLEAVQGELVRDVATLKGREQMA